MRKGLVSVLILAATFLGTVDGSGAVQVCLRSMACGFPTLTPTLGGSVSPRKLPANEYAPATWEIFGKVATSDGAHLSALREVVLDVDKDVKINSRNYPVCKGGRRAMEVLNTGAAEKACAKALVGRGDAQVEVAFPESTPMPLSSRLLVFNGGEGDGVTKLLIHFFIPIPRPSAIVAVVEMTRKGSGLETISKIPVIADGYGSLLDFKLELGKTYTYKGKKVGYFEAKCPDGVFKANIKKILFKNEARVPGVPAQTVLKGSLAVPCTTQG